MKRKITGRFCERIELPKSAFDHRSFRWKKSGRAWVLVGCRRGGVVAGSADVARQAYVLTVPWNESATLALYDARKADNAAARARCLANSELRACLVAESVRRGLGGSVDWAEYFRNAGIS